MMRATYPRVLLLVLCAALDLVVIAGVAAL